MANWTGKHRPSGLDEVVGNRKALDEMRSWGGSWEKGDGPLLLHGPPGTGKTSAAMALARDEDWDVVEMNASDERTADSVKRIGGSAASTGTLAEGSRGRRLVLLDEVDNLHGRKDRGGAGALRDLLKEAHQPVILVCNDVYEVPRGVRNRSEEVKFKRLRKGQVVKALRRVCRRESVECEREALEAIAGRSDGDLRSAVNDMEALASEGAVRVEDVKATGYRDRKQNVFGAIDAVLKGDDLGEARRELFSVDETPDDLIHWLDSGLDKVYSVPELSRAHRFLDRADVYLGRVRSSGNYTFWGYATDMMASVSSAKTSSKSGWTRYGFPDHWSRMGRTKRTRKLREGICEKVSRSCHVSTREAREDFLPFLGLILGGDPATGRRLVDELDLNRDEVEFVGGEDAGKLLQSGEENDGKTEPTDRSGEGQRSLTDF